MYRLESFGAAGAIVTNDAFPYQSTFRADDAAHGDFALFVQTVASRYADHMVQTFLQKL